MAKKRRKRARLSPGGLYFDEGVERFSSGCTLLDCVLGGGWAHGRVINVVGDRSTGKTLVAIEACANYYRQHPDRSIYYNETEAAFDESYAQFIGMPVERVELVKDVYTVEDLHRRIKSDVKSPGLWITDSLDALYSEVDADDDPGKGSYGASKAKAMSRMFRELNQHIGRAGATVIIVSQVRDKLDVSFGRKTTRYGGKALDFYASQIVWLFHLGRITRTRKGVKRVVGVDVRAKLEKSKVGMPFRECEFPIYFTYGIEDVESGLKWLVKEAKRPQLAGFESQDEAKRWLQAGSARATDEEYDDVKRRVEAAVRQAWQEIEEGFLPGRRKYRS